MGAISATDIISIIQSEIENFDFDTESRETGEVIYVGDGIATIYGIDHAMYGEIVVFDNGVKGMVQDIRQNEIGVILFGRDHGIHEGTKVVRTKKKAGIPVGEGFIGRIINALGEPIDGKGDIKEEDYRPIENEAPGIVDRKSVDTPLETGILSIDSMFPIGRGQRELIIGDRQTGKTSIATDTIIKALMELLKQPLCHPLSLHEQVMTLIMANNGVFDTIETKEVKKYQGDILSYMDLSYPEIGQKIEENRAIDEELVNKIMDAVKEYKG